MTRVSQSELRHVACVSNECGIWPFAYNVQHRKITNMIVGWVRFQNSITIDDWVKINVPLRSLADLAKWDTHVKQTFCDSSSSCSPRRKMKLPALCSIQIKLQTQFQPITATIKDTGTRHQSRTQVKNYVTQWMIFTMMRSLQITLV